MTDSQSTLNQSVADLSQMSALIHQTHWYMRGKGFLTLHPKMDELRDGIEEILDEIAERLITVGGAPYSTLTEFAEHAQIKLAPTTYDIDMKTRLSNLTKAYKTLQKSFADAVKSTESDPVTQDIYIGALGQIDKLLWMLDAELA
ncbi:MAG: DNA starvation/stationary phase protection protein [Streptococcaceae bacterium]|jgi:starvation-inducible DNA-binding protein|nr:DNA starvation/stationary phase protection protein [Streptococcaceae bacterium]